MPVSSDAMRNMLAHAVLGQQDVSPSTRIDQGFNDVGAQEGLRPGNPDMFGGGLTREQFNDRFRPEIWRTNPPGTPFDEQMVQTFPPNVPDQPPPRDPLTPREFFDDEGPLPPLPTRDVDVVPVEDMLNVDNYTGPRTPVDLNPPPVDPTQPDNRNPPPDTPPPFFPPPTAPPPTTPFNPFIGARRLGVNYEGIGPGALTNMTGPFSDESGRVYGSGEGRTYDVREVEERRAADVLRRERLGLPPLGSQQNTLPPPITKEYFAGHG